MKEDFIQVKKGDGEKYSIEIYFASVNSTITVTLSDADFIRFLHQSARLINSTSSKFRLKVPDDISSLVEETEQENILRFYSGTFSQKNKVNRQAKPEADTIIYIPDDYVPLAIAEEITNTSGDFMESLGFELEAEENPIFSSFFKKLKYVFARTIGEEDLEQIYNKGKRALELRHLDLPTAEQTEKLASAAEKLVASLSGVEEGIIRCGALIVLKKKVNGLPNLIIQQLTSDMIVLLEKKPHVFKSLETMYQLLQTDIETGDTEEGEALVA